MNTLALIREAREWKPVADIPYARDLVERLADALDCEQHPEATCKECGGPNAVAWSAPNGLWNHVMGTPVNPRGEGLIVCPTCFLTRLAKEIGMNDVELFAGILADAIQEAGGKARASETLTAHDLANAVRLAAVRYREKIPFGPNEDIPVYEGVQDNP